MSQPSMKNKIVVQKNTTSRVSMKKFLWFAFFMYPFWSMAILYYDELKEFVGNALYTNLIIFIIFSIINYIYGQTNIKYYQVIFVCITTIIFIVLYAIDIHKSYVDFDSDYTLDIIEAFMIYMAGVFIIVPAQFATWLPFLAKFIWQNRKNTDNLKWD